MSKTKTSKKAKTSMKVQKPGWVPEPEGRIENHAFFAAPGNLAAPELNEERVVDALLGAACRKRKRLRYRPEDWGEPEQGKTYYFELKHAGNEPVEGLEFLKTHRWACSLVRIKED